jgi:carbonic anhydrase/acetyltransferase-like protein (isoleucine patch superfamily)
MSTGPLFRRTSAGVYIASTAVLTGEIEYGADCSFWFSAVVRGDVAKITFGARCNVQDCAVVHCDTGVPNVIGDDVVIGHNATVHGAEVGSGSLVGMGATLLGRSRIGRECLIAAGTVVAPGLVVPDRKVVMGVPGKIVRDVTEKDLEYMRWLPRHYVEKAREYVEGRIRAH